MVISLHCILQMSLYDFVIISIFFYLWSLRVAVPLDDSRVSAGVSGRLCGFPPQCWYYPPLVSSFTSVLLFCVCLCKCYSFFLSCLNQDLIEEQQQGLMYRPSFHQGKRYYYHLTANEPVIYTQTQIKTEGFMTNQEFLITTLSIFHMCNFIPGLVLGEQCSVTVLF